MVALLGLGPRDDATVALDLDAAWPNGSEPAPIVSERGVGATAASSSSSTIRHSPYGESPRRK